MKKLAWDEALDRKVEKDALTQARELAEEQFSFLDRDPRPVYEKMILLHFDGMKKELAEGRIKDGVDYAVLYKYGEARLFCNRVFKERILGAANKYKLTFASIHTYSDTVTYPSNP